jgi:hypothetical protein
MRRLFIDDQPGETRNQRLAHFFTLGLIAISLGIGLALRNSLAFATTLYINNEAGIRAEYPSNWLIDFEGDYIEDYIFRVRDVNRLGFKTTIQVGVLPFTPDMTERNIADTLVLRRSLTLSTYNEIDRREFQLSPDERATAVDYTFVFTEADPFLAPLPIVVVGRDILVIRRGQAIIITFIADAATFSEDLAIFERFLSSLEL